MTESKSTGNLTAEELRKSLVEIRSTLNVDSDKLLIEIEASPTMHTTLRLLLRSGQVFDDYMGIKLRVKETLPFNVFVLVFHSGRKEVWIKKEDNFYIIDIKTPEQYKEDLMKELSKEKRFH